MGCILTPKTPQNLAPKILKHLPGVRAVLGKRRSGPGHLGVPTRAIGFGHPKRLPLSGSGCRNSGKPRETQGFSSVSGFHLANSQLHLQVNDLDVQNSSNRVRRSATLQAADMASYHMIAEEVPTCQGNKALHPCVLENLRGSPASITPVRSRLQTAHGVLSAPCRIAAGKQRMTHRLARHQLPCCTFRRELDGIRAGCSAWPCMRFTLMEVSCPPRLMQAASRSALRLKRWPTQDSQRGRSGSSNVDYGFVLPLAGTGEYCLRSRCRRVFGFFLLPSAVGTGQGEFNFATSRY